MFELVKDEPENVQTDKNNDNISREQIDWTPLSYGSANFCTHELKRISSRRIEAGDSAGGIMFSLAFLFGGFGSILLLWLVSSETNDLPSFVYLASIPFFWQGISPFLPSKTWVFDKNIGWFWLGSKKLTDLSEIEELEKKYHLSEIAAVQVIEYLVDDSEGDYPGYELNLVMKNGTRHKVMDHGSDYMYKDGKMLARFLDVPYFD